MLASELWFGVKKVRVEMLIKAVLAVPVLWVLVGTQLKLRKLLLFRLPCSGESWLRSCWVVVGGSPELWLAWCPQSCSALTPVSADDDSVWPGSRIGVLEGRAGGQERTALACSSLGGSKQHMDRVELSRSVDPEPST